MSDRRGFRIFIFSTLSERKGARFSDFCKTSDWIVAGLGFLKTWIYRIGSRIKLDFRTKSYTFDCPDPLNNEGQQRRERRKSLK